MLQCFHLYSHFTKAHHHHFYLIANSNLLGLFVVSFYTYIQIYWIYCERGYSIVASEEFSWWEFTVKVAVMTSVDAIDYLWEQIFHLYPSSFMSLVCKLCLFDFYSQEEFFLFPVFTGIFFSLCTGIFFPFCNSIQNVDILRLMCLHRWH